MREPTPECSVVLPAFNEASGIAELVHSLDQILTGHQISFEIVIVDDGSTDATWQQIQRCAQGSKVKALRLARNFGQQIAIYAGIRATRGDVVVVMDVDGQDPPSLLPQMIDHIRDGYDVVNAVRAGRKEPLLKRACYRLFYRCFRWMAPFPIALDSGDFSAVSRSVADTLCSGEQHHPFYRGLRSWVGGRQLNLPYERHERKHGESKYSLSGLFLLGVEGITGFSKAPLRVCAVLGAAIAALSLTYTVVIVAMKLSLGYPDYAGWASLASLIAFLGGVQLMVLGVLGEYLGHVFDAVKGIPSYAIREREGFDLTIKEAD